MLVVSRKIGQRVCIGDDIRITIVRIDKNSVRIGIEASPEIPIQREELVNAFRKAGVELELAIA